MKKSRSEGGFTLVELAIAGMLGMVALILAGTLLVNTLSTGGFTQGQSQTLDDARTAMQKLEQQLRSADFIRWCDPPGSCVEIDAHTPTGGLETVRYTHADKELKREIYDGDTASWQDDGTLVERVVNPSGQPVFACDTDSTLLRVTVDLLIEPTPRSNPALNVHTSIRPRNFPSKQTCP